MTGLVADVGDVVRLYTADPFTDTTTGLATDPTAVTLTVERPDGTQLIYGSPGAGADGLLAHTGTGAYEQLVAIDQEGPWEYRWASTGTAQAAEPGRFYVRRPNVVLVP